MRGVKGERRGERERRYRVSQKTGNNKGGNKL